MFLGLVVFGILLGALGTFVLLTGRLPCTRRQILDATVVDNDHEGRQGLQTTDNYFDNSDHDDAFSETDGELKDSLSTGLQ